MEWTIIQYGELSEKQKSEVLEIFIDGFGHFMTFAKDREISKTLFIAALHPTYTYALVEEETVLGILGLATNKVRPIKLEMALCKELFGNFKGSLICKETNAIFQSKVVEGDKDLYIDVLATSKAARCKGVGTRLLEYCFALPGYDTYYIEVFSKNVNAKRLYEKNGFVAYKKSRFSPIAMKGYGYPIKLKK